MPKGERAIFIQGGEPKIHEVFAKDDTVSIERTLGSLTRQAAA
jgi:hypothetical protein